MDFQVDLLRKVMSVLMTAPLTSLAVPVKGPWDLLRLNEFIPPFLTLPDLVVTAAREDFRYMPTFVWTEASQLRCITVCHRAKGLLV